MLHKKSATQLKMIEEKDAHIKEDVKILHHKNSALQTIIEEKSSHMREMWKKVNVMEKEMVELKKSQGTLDVHHQSFIDCVDRLQSGLVDVADRVDGWDVEYARQQEGGQERDGQPGTLQEDANPNPYEENPKRNAFDCGSHFSSQLPPPIFSPDNIEDVPAGQIPTFHMATAQQQQAVEYPKSIFKKAASGAISCLIRLFSQLDGRRAATLSV